MRKEPWCLELCDFAVSIDGEGRARRATCAIDCIVRQTSSLCARCARPVPRPKAILEPGGSEVRVMISEPAKSDGRVVECDVDDADRGDRAPNVLLGVVEKCAVRTRSRGMEAHDAAQAPLERCRSLINPRDKCVAVPRERATADGHEGRTVVAGSNRTFPEGPSLLSSSVERNVERRECPRVRWRRSTSPFSSVVG